MTERTVSAALRRQVIARADHRCEYCRLPAAVAFFPHEVDHVVAVKHGGLTTEDNLAYACWRCNRHKGTDLGSFDPLTQQFSFLFNPRLQLWTAHFDRHSVAIHGSTPEGRTTVALLHLNSEERRAERRRLIPNQPDS